MQLIKILLLILVPKLIYTYKVIKMPRYPRRNVSSQYQRQVPESSENGNSEGSLQSEVVNCNNFNGDNAAITADDRMLEKINTLLSNSLSPIMSRLDEIERNSINNVTVSDAAELPQQPQLTGKNVYVMQSPTKPIFDGFNVNPMRFLEDLERYIVKMNIADSLGMAKECLIKDARNWAKIFEQSWITYDNFKTDYLEQYWGKEAQDKAKRKLNNGKWNQTQAKTMFNYYAELLSEAKQLTNYLSEESIVEEIMKHFPEDIRKLWSTTSLKGAASAARFLRNVEGASEPSRHTQNIRPQFDHQKPKAPRVAAIENIRKRYNNWVPEYGSGVNNSVNESQLTQKDQGN